METPMMVAMIICDQIITEAGTNKKSIIGCFNNVTANSFPCLHPNFFVFISLTNGSGGFKSKLKCVNEKDGSILFEIGGNIMFKNPMQTIEIGFKLVNLTFPNDGNYAIQFWCNEVLLMTRKISVQFPKPETL